jgi:MYXO-CTERM domain-containing protein
MKSTLALLVGALALSTTAWAGLPVTVWGDGFESGNLNNWTFVNPSGDGTAMAAVSGAYGSSQGTIVPCEGQYTAQIYKDNGGLAYLISAMIPAVPGQLYEIDLCVGGLGMWDNCGFRWNKWGYSPDGGGTLTWVGDNFRNVNPLQCGISYQFTATTNQINVLLGLDRNCRDGLGHSAFFDNVQVSTTPEPTAMILLALGGLAMLRRR